MPTRETIKVPELPKLSEIDFADTTQVRDLVRERHENLYGLPNDGYIDEYMDIVEELFAGRHSDYQANDTAYHDITHTLQVTLCLVELINRRHRSDATPRISADDFRRAVVAALFHDIGYLKTAGDSEGSGAKYTHLHEQRSCDFARLLLQRRGWRKDDIRFVESLIGSTGPRVDLTRFEYRSETERLLGQAVCTADYIGQMSDPEYPDRLENLFDEFAESYRHQRIPQSEWPFRSYEALLRSTPDFWNTFVKRKLDVECAGLWRHFDRPAASPTPYVESVERNLATIRERIAGLDQGA
jgi:hypothetical protein